MSNHQSPTEDSDTRKKYREILHRNGIDVTEITEMTILIPEFAGDNFASKCETVSVHFKDSEQEVLELFAKKAMQNNKYAQVLQNIQLYEKEAGFFNFLLPQFTKFCQGRAATGNEKKFLKNLFPTCYHADENLVVLENLVVQGYKMMDKKEGHDFDQAVKVITKLAKLHAVSYSLIEEMGGAENFIEKYPFTKQSSLWTAEGEKVHGPWVNGTIKASIKILEDFPVPGSHEILEFLRDYQRTGYLELCEYFEVRQKSCANVLNHGDIWNCNILFKLANNSSSTAQNDDDDDDNCILVDLQTIHVGSPVLDLLYYLFLAVKPPLRRQCWSELLAIYYEKLKHFVQNELKGQLKFSLDDLIFDMRAKCKPGFVLGLYMVYGWDILEGFGDPDTVQDASDVDMAEILNSTMADTIWQGILGREAEYSKKLVEAWEEYKRLKL